MVSEERGLLFGSAYYHEYMPDRRLETDLDWMREAGFSVIRVGESTWTDWEPCEGGFQSEWMREILDQAHARGIRVILGFPTYSIPPWLHRLHPDIVVNHQSPHRAEIGPDRMPTYPALAPPGAYGPRQNQDYCHPIFLSHAARITGLIMDAFADHPAVVGYQVDNETGPSRVASPYASAKFRQYLQEKFGSPSELNRRFLLAFWGQKLSTWDDLPMPDGLLNPGLKLEWDRFQRRVITDYLVLLIGIVRGKKKPWQVIIHDFIGGLLPSVDQKAIARELDVVAVNIYYPTQGQMNPEPIWLASDVARSLKGSNFWVTETNAQAIGWDSRTQHPPYPGQLGLAALAMVSAGADMVSYWHWASLHNGQETFWRGVLGHDLQKNRIFHEIAEIGALLTRLGPELVGQSVPSQVAILYSADSAAALDTMPFDDRLNYGVIVRSIYRHLLHLGVQTDFTFATEDDLSRYRVLIVPPLYVASDQELERIQTFVERGGHALLFFKSGFCNEDCTVRRETLPGPLRQVSGICYSEFTNLATPVPLRSDQNGLMLGGMAHVWADLLTAESAEVLASLDDANFPNPVITRNNYGRGTLTYQATVLDDEFQRRLLRDVLSQGAVPALREGLPEGVHLRQTKTRGGHSLFYYFNFTQHAQTLRHEHPEGVEMVKGRRIGPGGEVDLNPWSCAVVRSPM